MVAIIRKRQPKFYAMKVVKVYGALRKKLGQSSFEFDVCNPAEALKALFANFPDLKKWMIDSEKDGIGYQVTIGKEKVSKENIEALGMPWSERDVFSIRPVIAGAGRGGWGSILVGALLVTAAIAFAPAGAGFLGAGLGAGGTTFTLGAGASTFIGAIGTAMIFGGIAQLLSPTPSLPKRANTLESFNFSGINNTSQVGTPVPICYGRLFVGSTVISSGLDVDQVL